MGCLSIGKKKLPNWGRAGLIFGFIIDVPLKVELENQKVGPSWKSEPKEIGTCSMQSSMCMFVQ